jgi:exodeoxyribonuclease VII small subunit
MSTINYQETKLQLDALINRFESEDITIEEAIDNYKKAQTLIEKLEKYLSETKLKIDNIVKHKGDQT